MADENKSVMFGSVNIITHFDAFPKLFDTYIQFSSRGSLCDPHLCQNQNLFNML